MKFIFDRLNIGFIKIYKQNVIYINNDDNNVIDEHRKISDDRLEI